MIKKMKKDENERLKIEKYDKKNELLRKKLDEEEFEKKKNY